MKNFRFLLLTAGITLLACVVLVLPAQAQTNNPANTRVDKASKASVKLPFCDQVLTKTSRDLQEKANKSCETATVCVPCVERTSKSEIYATLYAQPKSAKCKVATNITTLIRPTAKEPDFNFEISQSVCTANGVTLRVVFPESSVEAANYTYTWEVDRKDAGNDQQASCVCGKSVSVTVTEKSTRRSVSKTMDMQSACQVSKN